MILMPEINSSHTHKKNLVIHLIQLFKSHSGKFKFVKNHCSSVFQIKATISNVYIENITKQCGNGSKIFICKPGNGKKNKKH